MNKKGFTLVELIVVLVLLTIIMTIAIPNITSTIERRKEKEQQLRIELVVSAAELYIDMNENNISSNISLEELYCNGYLTKEQISNPLDEGNILPITISCDLNKKECHSVKSLDYKTIESINCSN